jgi:hypothetical protein
MEHGRDHDNRRFHHPDKLRRHGNRTVDEEDVLPPPELTPPGDRQVKKEEEPKTASG